MLIVDMPMPRNCKECPAKEWGGACAITKQFEPCVGRPSWCPIKGELVRCGECKYGVHETNAVGDDMVMCENVYNPVGVDNWLMPPEWYCADGERKGGGNNADN